MEIIELTRKKGRHAVIVDIYPKEFQHPRKGKIKRLVLKTVDEGGKTFESSTVWLTPNKIGGLNITGNTVRTDEALGQLLEFLHINSTEELLGKVLYLYPASDNFLLPVIFDPELIESENNQF